MATREMRGPLRPTNRGGVAPQDVRKTRKKGPDTRPKPKPSAEKAAGEQATDEAAAQLEAEEAGSEPPSSDLTQLMPLNDANVLRAIRHQYLIRKDPYLHAGLALLALNPYTQRKNIYDKAMVHRYHDAVVLAELPPHVFAVVEQALRSATVQGSPGNQTIIVSGESGAGKTFSTTAMVEYLAEVCNDGTESARSIAGAMKGSSTVLEAFGNARTGLNKNSSRFAKFIRIHFDPATIRMSKANVQTFLLERTRVSDKPAGEANFHIFEQLVMGIPAEDLATLHLERRMGKYAYLADQRPSEHDAWFVQQKFQQTAMALEAAGIGDCMLNNLMRMIATTLHLGNISRQQEEDEAEGGCPLAAAAGLLRIDTTALRATLFERVLKIRGEDFDTVMTTREFHALRDTLAKTLYVGTFDHVVQMLNRNDDSDPSTESHFIGFFDIFGFEVMPNNSLEQLCINYANEKLQQLFIERCLCHEQQLYIEEGLDWNNISVADNTTCVELIEGRYQLFQLLNEECTLSNRRASVAASHQSEEQNIASKLAVSFKGHSSFFRPLAAGTMSFGIEHYASKVVYDATEFVTKNQEQKPDGHIRLLQGSTDEFVAGLVPTPNGKRQRTVVSKFKSSLSKVFEVLRSTEPHYIRCIKPNQDAVAGLLDDDKVAKQLTASGVIESIKVSASGLPYRLRYDDFAKKFADLVKPGDTVRTTVEATLPASLADAIKYGKTRMFLGEEQLVGLERARTARLDRAAVAIQTTWRMFAASRRFAKLRWATVVIQSWWRDGRQVSAPATPPALSQAPGTPSVNWADGDELAQLSMARPRVSNPASYFLATPARHPIGLNWMGAPIIPIELINELSEMAAVPPTLAQRLGRTIAPKPAGHILSYSTLSRFITFKARKNPIPNSDCVPLAFQDLGGLLDLLL